MDKKSYTHRYTIIALVFLMMIGFLDCSAINGHSKEQYIGREGEKPKDHGMKEYRRLKGREGETEEWRVRFRGIGRAYAIIEKNAGFNKANSYKFYIQFSGGDLMRVNIRKFDRKAKEAGVDIFPLYLPEGIRSYVIRKDAESSALPMKLKDGDKITITGRFKESPHLRSSTRTPLTGFVYIAEEIKRGW